MSNDLINGLFEFGGALLICLSILRLNRDKCVRGVSPYPVAFFASLGFWNIYYYPSLDQWYSFVGGLAVVTANTVWLSQMIYYLYKERNEQQRRAIISN
jgi:hypothetical protein